MPMSERSQRVFSGEIVVRPARKGLAREVTADVPRERVVRAQPTPEPAVAAG